MILTRRPVRRP